MRLHFLFAFALVAAASAARAAVRYASPDGNASWAEATQPSRPCDLSTAAENAGAGDTVYLLNGTYRARGTGERYLPAFRFTRDGTPDRPIVVQSLSGDARDVVITLSSGAGGPVIGQYKNHGLTIRAVTVEEGPTFLGDCGAVTFWNSTGGRIEDSVIVGRDRNQSDNHSGVRAEGSESVTVRNCFIHGFKNSRGPADHNNTGTTTYKVSNFLVERSTFYDNTCGTFDKVGGEGSIYRHNLYVDNARHFFAQSSSPKYRKNVDNVVHNNVFVGGGSHGGVVIGRDSHNLRVFNNTFYDVESTSNEWAAIVAYSHSDTQNVQVYNNLLHSCGRAIRFVSRDLVSICDYNQFFAAGSEPFIVNWTRVGWDDWGFDAHSVVGDPDFVAPGGEDSEDYQRRAYPTDGRGGHHAAVIGAWLSDLEPEQIGYSEDAPSGSDGGGDDGGVDPLPDGGDPGDPGGGDPGPGDPGGGDPGGGDASGDEVGGDPTAGEPFPADTTTVPPPGLVAHCSSGPPAPGLLALLLVLGRARPRSRRRP